MIQTKVAEKMITHVFNNIFSPRKSCHLWDNVGKHGGTG